MFKFKFYTLFVVLFFLLATSLFIVVLFLNQPPTNFPHNEKITIKEGSGVMTIAEILKEKHVIHSRYLFTMYTSLFTNKNLKAGVYTMFQPYTMIEIIEKLQDGSAGVSTVKITHIEGQSLESTAINAENKFAKFSSDEFINIASSSEGFLFPETYHLSPKATPKQLYDLMKQTYEERVSIPYQDRIISHHLSEKEIIILASILEREANTPETKKMVSGILQNRLKINMPLQADASIEYVLDKPLSALTPNDLREIDSPYNTYLYTGLPPTPINNPGIDAIKAVLYPIHTDYLFYITGNDGNFYYATNFDDHRRNIQLYLR